MKQISFNPAHKHLFSEDFITGFNEGAKRQFENDIRPKGKWIWDRHNGEYYCSECKEVQEDIKTVMGFPDWNFCPNCGSDMRGEQDDQ